MFLHVLCTVSRRPLSPLWVPPLTSRVQILPSSHSTVGCNHGQESIGYGSVFTSFKSWLKVSLKLVGSVLPMTLWITFFLAGCGLHKLLLSRWACSYLLAGGTSSFSSVLCLEQQSCPGTAGERYLLTTKSPVMCPAGSLIVFTTNMQNLGWVTSSCFCLTYSNNLN